MAEYKCNSCNMDFSRAFEQIPVYFASGSLYLRCPGCNHTIYLKWNKGKLEFVKPREKGTVKELSSFSHSGIKITRILGQCQTCFRDYDVAVKGFKDGDRLMCLKCNEAITLIDVGKAE